MSSLAGHVAAFLIMFPIGIRRLWSSLSLQARSSPSFRPRPWYFSPEQPLRHADLYALLLLLPIAAFCDYFIFLSLPAPSHADAAAAASFRFSFALHAACLSVFVLLLVVILVSHRFPLLLPDDLLFLLAALAFLSDLASSPRPAVAAVDTHAAKLAAVSTLTCAASCFVLSLRRSAAADVALAMGMALKGSWALQAGISLYALPPRGCSRNAAGGEGWLECVLEEDGRRVLAMLDLLFASHAAAAAAVCLGMQYWIAVKSAKRTAHAEAIMTRLVMSRAELELD